METESINIADAHMWALRKNIEDKMNQITDMYKQSSDLYYELSELADDYEEFIDIRKFHATYDENNLGCAI